MNLRITKEFCIPRRCEGWFDFDLNQIGLGFSCQFHGRKWGSVQIDILFFQFYVTWY